MSKKELHFYLPFIIAFAVLLGGGIYSYVRINRLALSITDLSAKLSLLDTRLSSTTDEFKSEITKTSSSFSEAINQQKNNTAVVEERLKKEVGTVAGTLNTLQKLSKTDPELLVKYSKVYFLNENYAPDRTVEIPNEYKYSNTKAVSIHADVWPHIKTLIDDAKKNNIEIYVSSGYRSFDEQKYLKSDYRVTYGAGTANQFSADQGYSEHQLGTAVDFITSGIGGDLDRFEGTSAYTWLLANAYKYGFILSYPKNNQYYVFEPWHWRYVGVKLATDLKNQGKNFYDLDQRKIDEYLINVFE